MDKRKMDEMQMVTLAHMKLCKQLINIEQEENVSQENWQEAMEHLVKEIKATLDQIQEEGFSTSRFLELVMLQQKFFVVWGIVPLELGGTNLNA